MEFEGFSFKGFLKLIRVGNLAIVGLTQYMAAIFLGNRIASWIETAQDPKLAILIISTLCIAAAGYIINDYYDIKIDYINKPNRVLVGDKFSIPLTGLAFQKSNRVGNYYRR